MIVVVVMSMVIMPGMLFAVVTVVMTFKSDPFSEGEPGDIVDISQLQDDCVAADGVDRFVQKGLKLWPDPDDHVGVLDVLGLRWTQAEAMRRPSTLNDHRGCRDAIHNTGNERVDRLDGGYDFWIVGSRSTSEGKERDRCKQGFDDVHKEGPHGRNNITLRDIVDLPFSGKH